jgi:ribonuclease P protein component
MLAKNSRLKKNKEFDLVFKEGKTTYGSILGIKVRENQLGINRFGVLLSTKVSKLAVTRNIYKRRIKDILKNQNLKIKTGYDCVIIVLPAIIGKSYQEIEADINTAFNKLKFYR